MNTIKNKLNIVGKCFVKENNMGGEILSFVPDVPITAFLDDILFILSVPSEDQKFSSAYIRLQNKSDKNNENKQEEDFTEVRSIGYLKENKKGDIIVCAPRQHVRVDLSKLVFIATMPGVDKNSAPVYIKKKTYEKNKAELAPAEKGNEKVVKIEAMDTNDTQIDEILKEIAEEQE